MNMEQTLDILKQALLMEKRGHSFYSAVALHTNNPEVKKIFQIMADEETTHIKFLSEQFSSIKKNQAFDITDLPENPGTFTTLILSDEVMKNISSAGYEAAAITAAIDMEKKAIDIYGKQAEITTDPQEKSLFTWLGNWEKGHLKILNDLDNELKEKIWFDSQFWPF